MTPIRADKYRRGRVAHPCVSAIGLQLEPNELNAFRRSGNADAAAWTFASIQGSNQEGRNPGDELASRPARQSFLHSCLPAFLIFSWEALAKQSGAIGR